ncbi:MAG: flavohemoglobin expression-modulating QEGLA motif protein [Gemmatimonadota bacterium]
MQTASSHRGGVSDPDAIREAFERGAPLSASEGDVQLRLDGAHPFLVIVRESRVTDPLARLVRGEAAYLRAGPGADANRVRETVREVAAAGVREHGGFLLIELWAGDRYRVLGPDGPAPGTVRALAEGLESLDVVPAPGAVEVVGTRERSPPGSEPLLPVGVLHELGALLVGVELKESWRDPDTGAVYPVFLRQLGHALSTVLRHAAFEFLRVQTGTRLPSYRALGRRSLGDAVWEADRRLAEISGSFDGLLLVSPVNERAAWERFRDDGYDRPPDFRYRLLPVEPDLLKRELYQIRLEEVEDPAAWKLLRDKREELDRQISLVADRGSPEFLHSSIRLFGTVASALRDRAEETLAEIPPPDSAPSREDRVGAEAFAELARREFDYYRALYPAFASEVQIRPDLVGLMVSSGRLLVGRELALWPDRVEALLQHEVGTHVLTYVNGLAQPFLQLARGFADYDETQEGLGVLAEYMVDGLTPARMRLLAARVLAVDDRIEGADFVEGFRRLHRDHGFEPATAFDITARVHQSGGFTRDQIYLRGLLGVVEYLRDGGPLQPLYVGKIAARQLDVIREMQERKVLAPVPLLPRFLTRDDASRRLAALRDGLPLHGMVSTHAGVETA